MESTLNKSCSLPSNAEFVKDEAAIPWEYNVPFKVLQLDEVTTVNGDKQMIVKMQKPDNTDVNAWATKIIKNIKNNNRKYFKDTREEYVYHESWKEDSEKVENLLLWLQ